MHKRPIRIIEFFENCFKEPNSFLSKGSSIHTVYRLFPSSSGVCFFFLEFLSLDRFHHKGYTCQLARHTLELLFYKQRGKGRQSHFIWGNQVASNVNFCSQNSSKLKINPFWSFPWCKWFRGEMRTCCHGSIIQNFFKTIKNWLLIQVYVSPPHCRGRLPRENYFFTQFWGEAY